MASRKLEITVSSAQNLKNVDWRYGPLRSHAVLWVDRSPKFSTSKCCTRVDDDGETSLVWNDTVVIPLPPGPVEDQTLYIDVVHVRSESEEDTKPLIGSAKLKLRDVIEEAGYGERLLRSLHLKLPSGRPHGNLKVKVAVKDPAYGRADPYYAPPNGVQRQASSRYYSAAPPSGYRYAAPSPSQALYRQPSYGQNQYAEAERPKSKVGMGMGMALFMGALAGAFAGLSMALEKEEDDIGYGDDD